MFRGRFFQAALRISVLGVFAALVSGSATANCFRAGEELSSQEIRTFLGDPHALLGGTVGGRLTTRVRDLVASDPETLSAVIQLLQGATETQQRSLGLGLALAANQCQMRDPDYAADIQQKVAESNMQAAIAWFDRTRRGSGGNHGFVSGIAPDLRTNTTALATGRSALPITTFATGGATNTVVSSGSTVSSSADPVVISSSSAVLRPITAGTSSTGFARGAFAATPNTGPGSFFTSGSAFTVFSLSAAPVRSVSP
jgi:hypothetical protein